MDRRRRARASVRGRVLRRGDGRLRRPEPVRARQAGCTSCAECSVRAAGSRSSRSRDPRASSPPSTASGSTSSYRPPGKVLPGGSAYTYLPASVRRFPDPQGLARAHGRGGLRRDPLAAVRRRDRRTAHRGRPVSALATVRAAPGLDAYLDQLEDRLAVAVAARPGLVAEIGAEALASGGKRLRPLLVFLAARSRGREPGRGRCRDRARAHGEPRPRRPDRRRPAAARASLGLVRLRPGCGASRRRLSLRARLRRARGDRETRRAVAILADAALALVRGEGLERAQRRRPDTTVEEYLTRCALKTAKLFEAACLLSSRRPELGEFGLALGIAFQIVDDCLDCAGQTVETGKIAGTDLREGIPTLPLLLAAQEDEVVRGPRSRAARSTARCSESRRAARSRRPGRSHAATRSGHSPASTASRRATSSRRSPKPW